MRGGQAGALPDSAGSGAAPSPGACGLSGMAVATLNDPCPDPDPLSSLAGKCDRTSPACLGSGGGGLVLAALAADLQALMSRAEAEAGPAAAAALLQAALASLASRAGLCLSAASPRGHHHSFTFAQATPPASALAGRALWRRALAAATAAARGGGGGGGRAAGAGLDPWASTRLWAGLPMRRATRHRYDAGRGAWTVDTVLVKLEAAPFAAGAMRECRRMVKLSTWGSAWASCDAAAVPGDGGAAPAHASTTDPLGWSRAPPFVAKRYRPRGGGNASTATAASTYLTDVRLQMDAKRLAEAYDRTDPPKKVDVIAACALEVHPLRGEGGGPSLAGFYAAENAISGARLRGEERVGGLSSQIFLSLLDTVSLIPSLSHHNQAST